MTEFHAEFPNFMEIWKRAWIVQNIEFRLPVNSNWAMWIFCSFTAGEWAVYVSWCIHCFVWGRGALTVKGCGPKTGGMLGDYGCVKNITVCIRNANLPEAAKFQIQNSIFSPLQMPPLRSAAWGACPLRLPFPLPLFEPNFWEVKDDTTLVDGSLESQWSSFYSP